MRRIAKPMWRALLLSSALALAFVAAPAAAQTRIPTVTRLVKQFVGLEDELAAALRSGDALFCMKTGRAANRDEIHRPIIE